MKRSVFCLSLLFLCYSTAYANLPLTCDNLDDHPASCAASDDCVGQCAGPWGQRVGLNPLLPGFLTGFVDRQLVVTGVIPQSPASEAGVEIGDRLVAVDDVRLPAPYGLQAIWQRAGEHRLTVERAGRLVHFSLTPIPERAILARAWSDFDPIGQSSVELVAFARRRPAALAIPRKAFLSGMKIANKDLQFTVAKVLPGSAAEAAGIRKGDVIVRSNTTELESSDARTALSMTVARGNRTFSVSLRMTSVSEVLKAMAEKQQEKEPVPTRAGL